MTVDEHAVMTILALMPNLTTADAKRVAELNADRLATHARVSELESAIRAHLEVDYYVTSGRLLQEDGRGSSDAARVLHALVAAPSASVGGVEAGVAQTAAEGPSNVDGNRGADRASGEEQRSCKPLVPGSIPGPSLDPTQRASDAWVTFECKHCHVWVRGNPGFTFDAPCGRSSGEHEWERLRPNEASPEIRALSMNLAEEQAFRNAGQLCDMMVGPCACGATHAITEWPSRQRRAHEALREAASPAPVTTYMTGDLPRTPEAETTEQIVQRYHGKSDHEMAWGIIAELCEALGGGSVSDCLARGKPRTDHPRPISECPECHEDVGAGDPHVDMCSRPALAMWRVGRKLGRTIYWGDVLHGMVDLPEIAKRICDAMNAAESRPETASPKLRADLDAWVERFIRPHFEGKCDGLTKDDCVETIRLDLERLATHEKGEGSKP